MWPKKNGKNNDRLFLYIVISLVVHLSILYFIPFGDLIDAANNQGRGQKDFGFVQYVEIKPSPPKKPKNTIRDSEHVEEKKEKTKKPKPTEKEKPKKETSEKNIEQKENIKIEEEKTETKKTTKEKQEDTIEPTNQEQKQQEVIASEESESEIEVKKEVSETKNGPKEPNNENKKNETEKQEEPTEPPPPTTADLIGQVRPYYPKDLVAEGRTGQVTLLADINSQGRVNNLEVLKSSGIDKMDRVAMLTIKNEWSFKSYQKGYTIEINVKYKMNEEGDSTVNVDLGSLSFK